MPLMHTSLGAQLPGNLLTLIMYAQYAQDAGHTTIRAINRLDEIEAKRSARLAFHLAMQIIIHYGKV